MRGYSAPEEVQLATSWSWYARRPIHGPAESSVDPQDYWCKEPAWPRVHGTHGPWLDNRPRLYVPWRGWPVPAAPASHPMPPAADNDRATSSLTSSARCWAPKTGSPSAVLFLVHGVNEHVSRYVELAHHMTAQVRAAPHSACHAHPWCTCGPLGPLVRTPVIVLGSPKPLRVCGWDQHRAGP